MKTWNESCDAVNNKYLKEAGFQLIEGVVPPEDQGRSEEEIHAANETDEEDSPPSDESGSGQGEASDDSEEGGIPTRDDMDPEENAPQDAAEQTAQDNYWKEALAEAVQAAKDTNTQGDVPGGLWTLVNSLLDPEVPWEDQLAKWIGGQGPRSEATYTRPSRRNDDLPSYRLPSLPEAVVLIDTSGSVGEKTYQRFASIAAPLLESLGIATRVILNDAEIQADLRSPEANDLLKRHGHGGSDFTPAFDLLEKDEFDGILIVLTDGFITVPEKQPKQFQGVLWVIAPEGKVPATWGNMIQMRGENHGA